MEDGPKGLARWLPTGALALALVLPAALLALWSRPQAAVDLSAPPLVLRPDEVRAVRLADRAAAARAPGGELAEERRRLYRETNLAAGGRSAPQHELEARRRRLRNAFHQLTAGDDDLRNAVRAEDLQRLDDALRDRLPSPRERLAVLGDFPSTLMERYGLTKAGRQVAPDIVVRSLFKARWNVIHGLEAMAGLARVEQQAYHGWLALHARNAEWPLRLRALAAYEAVGGVRAAEARALLRCQAGMPSDAEAFDEALAAGFTFRLRNQALACYRAAE